MSSQFTQRAFMPPKSSSLPISTSIQSSVHRRGPFLNAASTRYWSFSDLTSTLSSSAVGHESPVVAPPLRPVVL